MHGIQVRCWNILLVVASVITFNAHATAQNHVLTGSVRDAVTSDVLIFAHIFVEETGAGVVTNKEGNYRLQLPPGTWTLRVSYIGYRSKVRQLTVHEDMSELDFSLQPRAFDMPEVTVTPDDSLARLIVTRARLKRIARDKELQSYHMRAHNKIYSRIDRTEGMSEESGKKLTAFFLDIGETQTEAWFAQPDKNKEKIHARQQSDLFQDFGNRFTSGFARMDCSQENITFGPKSVTGPISEDGLDNMYYYSVAGESEGDQHRVWRIRVLPRSRHSAAASGYYFIEDSTWSITQVELTFTPAACAMFLPIMERLSYKQQFSLYDHKFWLPSAASILVQAHINALGMQAWLSMEGTSVIAEYECNPADIDSVFDEYRVEVLPTADSFSSSEWEMRRLQPRSLADDTVYQISDSMAVIRLAEEREYHAGHVIGGKELKNGDLISQIPGVVNAVRFNRVEGISMGFPYAGEDRSGVLRKYALDLRQGFLDRRTKGTGSATLALGKKDKSFLSVEASSDMRAIFREQPLFSDFLTTAMAIWDRYDKVDYYYRAGGSALWEAHVLPWLRTEIGAGYAEHQSASKHTDWSLFGEGTYRENPRIREGRVASASLTFRGDFRPRMLEVRGVVRPEDKPSDFVPSIGLEYNTFDLDAGTWNVFIPRASLSGSLSFGTLGSMNFSIAGSRATGRLPVQSLLTLPASESWLTTSLRFRTAEIGEFGGDEQALMFLDHNFGKLPFMLLGLPSLGLLAADMWELHLFAGAGWTRMRAESQALLTREMNVARRPLVELGLSIDRVFGIMRIDAAYRLTHTGQGRNYFMGLSISP